jgi:peptide/nickel transport system substrate-binding protein
VNVAEEAPPATASGHISGRGPGAAPTATAASSPSQASAPLSVVSASGPARTFHPYPDAAAYSQPWMDIAALIWGGADGSGGLLAFDWATFEYRPALAQELPRQSADGRTFTFTLRDHLQWSDGTPLTADDFRYAYDQASRDDSHYVQLELVQEIAAYRALDLRTLEITLKSARPRELALNFVNVITPVPRHVWAGRAWADAESNSEILQPTVVLGPFKPVDTRTPDHVVFTPVETYPGGTPRIPRVDLLLVPQPAAGLAALQAGTASWMRALPADQARTARADGRLSVLEWLPANAAYRTIEFNVARPFLSDRRVRQALAYAVDRGALIGQVEGGAAVPQYGPLPPGNTHWAAPASSLAAYDVDLTRARALLEVAGYRLQDGRLLNRDSQPVRVQIAYPTSSAARGRIASALQTRYRELGLEVETTGLDFAAFTDQVQVRREFDLALGSYGGGSLDPDLSLRPQFVTSGPQNVTSYSNAQLDELFRQAAVELDPARRQQLYVQAQEQLNADVPVHYLYALKSIDVVSRTMQGAAPRGSTRLEANDALLSWSIDR